MAAPQVVSAAPAFDLSGRPTRVALEFDQAIDPASGLLDPLCYSVDGGLLVRGVSYDPGFPLVATLLTTEQVLDRHYVVTASGVLKLSAPPFTPLDPTRASAEFFGLGAPADYVVSDLRAKTHPHGRSIELLWTNPAGVTHCRVYRRLKSWPFELGVDLADVIYDGAAIDPGNLTPTEPKVTDSGLLDDEFYYYSVVVRQAPADFIQTSESRVYALSGRSRAELRSTEYIQKRLVPRGVRESDLKSSGEIDRFTKILGGSTDVLRSVVRSAFSSSNWVKAAYPSVQTWSRALGFVPEGETYDFDTPRRVLIQLRELYSKKGTLPGIIQATKALVQWIVETEEFGLDEMSRLFGTSDVSDIDSNSGATVSFSQTKVVDSTKAWADLQWQGGRLRDGLGNWFDVLNTTGGVNLFLEGLPSVGSTYRRSLTAVAGAGSNSGTLDSVLGLRAGQRVQFLNTSTGAGQIVEITHVDPVTKIVQFWNPLLVSYPVGTAVSWRVTKPEASFSGKTAAGSGLNLLVVGVFGAPLSWPMNRWSGLQAKDSFGGIHTVVGSTSDSLTFSDGFAWAPGADFTIAKSFTAGTPDAYYEVHTGYMPLLYDPLFDLGLIGTRFDPFHYLYGGRASLTGVFGACDLGLYLIKDWLDQTVPLAVSRCTSVSGGVLTDATASFSGGEFVGQMLLPNQNVPVMFEILANSATTITAAGDLAKYAVPGQAYVVLSPRDAERYKRLLARIKEFSGDDVCPRVLFL